MSPALKSIEAAPTSPATDYIAPLDGLRGVAILLVLLHNVFLVDHAANRIVWLVAIVANFGWAGVQLFFVLSGFLITRNLLRSQGADNYYRAFFGRRILRIFPLYYAALLLGLVVIPMLLPGLPGGNPLPQADQIWLWTFLFNWTHPLGAPAYGFPHFWSLAVEEQFYLLWPLIVHRMRPGRLLKISLLLVCIALMTRIAMRLHGASPEMVYEFTICRMDALAIGSAAAALFEIPAFLARMRAVAASLLPIAAILGLLGALMTHFYIRDTLPTQTAGQTILSIVFALLLIAATVDRGNWNKRLQKMLQIHWLRSVGKYSYAMYVLHYPIYLATRGALPAFEGAFGGMYPFAFFLLDVALTYLGALASYHLLEKHFLRLKTHFVPRQRLEAPEPA